MKGAIAKFHGGRVVPDSPARGESQSNGRAEEAGKTDREFNRVFKDQIEEKAKMTLQCDDSITLWIIRWAAMVCSRYLVGRDGRTGFERTRGRRCKIKLACIGEKVWYKEIQEQKTTGEAEAMELSSTYLNSSKIYFPTTLLIFKASTVIIGLLPI